MHRFSLLPLRFRSGAPPTLSSTTPPHGKRTRSPAAFALASTRERNREMRANYAERADHCCCSSQCPKITAVVFLSIAAIFSIVPALGISDNEHVVQNTPWMVHWADYELDGCPNGTFISSRGNYDRFCNFWGCCTKLRIDNGQSFGPTFCQSWSEIVDGLDFLGTDTYCERNGKRTGLAKSEFGVAACAAEDNKRTLGALSIIGTIFTWFMWFGSIGRLAKDSVAMRVVAAVLGIVASAFTMATLILYAVENYPRQEETYSTICSEVVEKITYFLAAGWILELLTVFIVWPCTIVLILVPHPPKSEPPPTAQIVSGPNDAVKSGVHV